MSLQDFSTLIAGLFPEVTERSSKRPGPPRSFRPPRTPLYVNIRILSVGRNHPLCCTLLWPGLEAATTLTFPEIAVQRPSGVHVPLIHPHETGRASKRTLIPKARQGGLAREPASRILILSRPWLGPTETA